METEQQKAQKLLTFIEHLNLESENIDMRISDGRRFPSEAHLTSGENLLLEVC